MRVLKGLLPTVMFLLLGARLQAQKVTISGYVRDSVTSESLIGVGISTGTAGSVTNNFGFYSLSLQQGTATIEYGYVGYETNTISIKLLRDTTINVLLQPNNELTGATITARKDAGLHSTYMGSIEIPISQIKSTPSVLGEADILKTVQLLPGVQAGTNGFTGLYVRGGGPEENLLMLDGVSLYNADHLLGLFSVFMPEAIKKVTLYKSSFPARYGGRISSVLDIRTNDGNPEETHGTFGINLLSSKIHVDGPLWKGKTSYSVSARMMHTIFAQPIIARLDNDEKYNYWFYDLNAKLTHRIGDNDRIYVNAYHGRDNLLYDGTDEHSTSNTNIHWGNTLASLRWNHVWNRKVFSNTTAAYNHYNMLTHSISDKEERSFEQPVITTEHTDLDYRSGIHDFDLMMDFDFTPSSHHSIRFGSGFTYHIFKPESLGASTKVDENGIIIKDTSYTQSGSSRLKGVEFSAYIEDNIIINRHLSVNPGLHLNVFNAQNQTYGSLQPRLSARYGFDNGLSIKTGYSRMSQNIHLLSSTQFTLPMDLWVPVTDQIKPVVSDQYSIGAYYDGLKGWEFSMEGYFKIMENVLEYKDGVVMLGNTSDWQDKVIMGKGRAYGVELFIQKIKGKTTGWLSYTLAKSERRFPGGEISGGAWFPYKYDRRHQLHLVLNHRFSSRIDLSGTWSFSTGGVLTLPVRETVVLSPDGKQIHQTDLLTTRGNYRLPANHRLNIGINFRKQKKHGERVWTLSVYNLYNAKSPDFVTISNDYHYIGSRIYSQDITLKMTTILPVLPSIGYTYNF